MSPPPVCNHGSGEHRGAHVLAFTRDALHDKLIGTGIIISVPRYPADVEKNILTF